MLLKTVYKGCICCIQQVFFSHIFCIAVLAAVPLLGLFLCKQGDFTRRTARVYFIVQCWSVSFSWVCVQSTTVRAKPGASSTGAAL